MSENKYTPYTPQSPTDGIVGSRAFKRQLWKLYWQKFLYKDDILNNSRRNRRTNWGLTWRKLNEMKG